MSKLTFRADDDLVERVEALDASKSEVMREALRAYLEDAPAGGGSGTLDALVAERVDALIEERLGAAAGGGDVNVNITLQGEPADVEVTEGEDEATRESAPEPGTCPQCGEPVDPDHVHCPNCGEKQSRRVFCECGDELRSDWSFCPSCGRRTAAADVLDGA